MRLKSSIWVAAYLRRCQTEGIFGAVRKRGAEEAGAVFVKIGLLDGNAMLYAPAPQTVYDESRPVERIFVAASPQPQPKPMSKTVSPAKCASIRMPGSSKSRTRQDGIFSIWRVPDHREALSPDVLGKCSGHHACAGLRRRTGLAGR